MRLDLYVAAGASLVPCFPGYGGGHAVGRAKGLARAGHGGVVEGRSTSSHLRRSLQVVWLSAWELGARKEGVIFTPPKSTKFGQSLAMLGQSWPDVA